MRFPVTSFGIGWLTASLLLGGAPPPGLTAPPPGADRAWSERFPEVAARIRYLDKRMASPDDRVRLRVLTELAYFWPRDSRPYPPFLRALLKDPSPKVRWQAVHRLWEHNHFLDKQELPGDFDVPTFGLVNWRDAKEVARLRSAVRGSGAAAGWAIHALGIIGDEASMPAARSLLSSPNVFTRFSAAVALIQLGEAKEGVAALQGITHASDDPSAFYRCRAAEVLHRLGDRGALQVLVQLLEKRRDYADGPGEILEDLTGHYYTTALEWRTWRQATERREP